MRMERMRMERKRMERKKKRRSWGGGGKRYDFSRASIERTIETIEHKEKILWYMYVIENG